MQRILVRDRIWRIQSQKEIGENQKLFHLLEPSTGETLKVLAPPELVEFLPDESPVFDKQCLSPLHPWLMSHKAIQLLNPDEKDSFAAIYSGRISPESYQFVPVEKLMELPRPRLLIADDVGLGKTIEAGICIMELMARGKGKRILLIVPPGLISQWQDEMKEKFGLSFTAIENATSLDRVQTSLSEGIKPWRFLDKLITSIEYIKKKEVMSNALSVKWDIIVVDEAHYLSESGTPSNPYTTARARMGKKLRESCNGLILLTATPHNGYKHSLRSLLEIVEPTDATFSGEKERVQRRVLRNMVRRLKPEIFKTDGKKDKQLPAFPPRAPVAGIPVKNLTNEEVEVFKKVSSYCAKMSKDSADEENSELVSFAMQIIKKRMLSSRAALISTVAHRLDSLNEKSEKIEPPAPVEVRELESDLPLMEAEHERIAERVIRSSVPREEKRRKSEKNKLNEIKKLLKKVEDLPDPKVCALVSDLKANVLSNAEEKAIVFTEYRDTLNSIKAAFDAKPEMKNIYVELTGGLSSRQRTSRMAAFEKTDKRILFATDAASEGLNLQDHCHKLYHFELPWNPNRMEQRNGRIDRHGQTMNPVIKYFFYPNSPEDEILNALVKKIFEMQADRVSTPDILGIISGARIEKILTDIDADDKNLPDSKTLFKVIDDKKDDFQKNVAPLISAGSASYGKDKGLNSFSADPMIGDDVEFENFIVSSLGGCIKKSEIEHTFTVTPPQKYKGAGVNDKYDCVTMRRSVAVTYPSKEVEFITRMHPLFRAILNEAYISLTASHSMNRPARRIAVRCHKLAKGMPYAVFSYAVCENGNPYSIVSVAVDTKGKVLDDAFAKLALENSDCPGEVSWIEASGIFEKNFNSLKETANSEAMKKLQKADQEKSLRRNKIAVILREDAGKYKIDRIAEIEDEEKLAVFTEDLFSKTEVLPFKAKKALVEDSYKKRLEEIENYVKPSDVAPPQPLGILFVFPTGGE